MEAKYRRNITFLDARKIEEYYLKVNTLCQCSKEGKSNQQQ